MCIAEAVAAVVESAVPHSCVVHKSQEGYLGIPDHKAQGSKCWEDKSPSLLAVKISGGWGSRRNCQIFRRVCLKVQHRLRTASISPTLGFTTRETFGRALVASRKWVK